MLHCIHFRINQITHSCAACGQFQLMVSRGTRRPHIKTVLGVQGRFTGSLASIWCNDVAMPFACSVRTGNETIQSNLLSVGLRLDQF